MLKKQLLFILVIMISLNSFSQTITDTKEWISNKLNYQYAYERVYQGEKEEFSYDIKVNFNEKPNVMTIYQSNLLDFTFNNNWSKEKTNSIIEIKINEINLNKLRYKTFECSSNENNCSSSLALRFFIYTKNKTSIKFINKTTGTSQYSEFPEFWFDIPQYVILENEGLAERLKKAFYHLAELSGSKKEVF